MAQQTSKDAHRPLVLFITADPREAFAAEKARAMAASFPIILAERSIKAVELLRNPAEVVRELEETGAEAVIAAAGVLSQLPAVIAAHTLLPVIAVPVRTELMNGLDTLMAAIRTPAACCTPVSAIDGGENAVLLAVEILALKYIALAQALDNYRASMKAHVRQQNEQLEKEMGCRGKGAGIV